MNRNRNPLTPIEDHLLEAVHGGMWARIKEAASYSTELGSATPSPSRPKPSAADLATFDRIRQEDAARPFAHNPVPPYAFPSYPKMPGQPQVSSYTPPSPFQWPGVKFAR